MDAKEIIKDAKRRMNGALNALRDELVKIRTGRATPNLLDGIKVEYYGQKVPLNQVATVTAPEPRLIVIQPWEKKMVAEIEREILKADLGFNPNNDGTVIRIPIPPLSEERRKDLVKLVHKFAEDARIAVRNVRRDANDQLKKLEKDHQISEDELSVYLDDVQDLTDDHIKKIDEMMKEKEAEILKV
ncbi:Ribosome-recycling factor [Caldithrix abyssi DSM 13497]|uniref:Ribosome-recycling factor n=1 Tax=Caldithrix abyssi DSM 13497 TaxID=880073 RepID=H1XXB8_CALAY|nr:ribosome recycling factor [Caldithrix abyssi]APF17836.1 frr ribosome recycling factor [Caldithrix abyssi DSM 13497]EHO41903.1 Ribosome-recycling factor [Caldithrix abyssi DSM 13497]